MACEAEELIVNFESFVKSHTSSERASTEKLLATLAKIDALPLDAFGGGESRHRLTKKNEAMDLCVNQHIANRLSEQFPILDESLFRRRRWIGVRFEEQPVLFASVLNEPKDPPPKSQERWANVPLLVESRSAGVTRLGSVQWPGRRSVSLSLHAQFPGSIGPSQSDYGYKALATMYRIYADLLDRPETAYLARQDLSRPSLTAYWIPSLDSIYATEERPPDRRDPALVLHAVGRRFLCCMWSAEGEEPLEAIMREFSSGGTVNVVSEDDEDE